MKTRIEILLVLFFPAVFTSCPKKAVDLNLPVHKDRCLFAEASTETLPLPPSEDWILVDRDEHRAKHGSGTELLCWHWEVRSDEEGLVVGRREYKKKNPELPPLIEEQLDNIQGDRSTLVYEFDGHERMGRNWLIGFDSGEFGGSLWWAWERFNYVKPVMHKRIRGLYETDDFIVVFTGLAHLSINYGKVFLIEKDPLIDSSIVDVMLLDGYPLDIVEQPDNEILVDTGKSIWLVYEDGTRLNRMCSSVYIDGEPRSYRKREGKTALLLTTAGLWEIKSEDEVERLCGFNAFTTNREHFYAPIFVEDDRVFVGMSYYLAKLDLVQDGCKVEWYVPAACSKTTIRNGRCMCTEGELAGKPCSRL